MKKFYVLMLLCLVLACLNAQTPYQRVYTILNTKCQNGSCHSATSVNDGPKFDGSASQVYSAIFNVPSSLYPGSVAKYEELIKPEHPYTSFLLRKIAGSQFDTDLALDSTGEGSLMTDTGGFRLSNVEIEFIRQWIRYGALQTYTSTDGQPDYTTIASYYDSGAIIPFLPKPPKPAAGTGFQFRMGPVFLPQTGAIEQEMLQQQEVNFPYLPEVTEIDGFMTEQSHHFLLFKYTDSISAKSPNPPDGEDVAPDLTDIAQITPSLSGGVLGVNAFEGNKYLTGAWQTNAYLNLPQGTAFMWDKKTYLDMDFHVKNYNATSVLPCDFYFNVYYKPLDPNTIPMISRLVNNADLGKYQSSCIQFPPNSLPENQSFTENYPDGDNGIGETRYLWMASGHTHQYGTAFYIFERDTLGNINDTIYSGQYDYANNVELGYWDHTHPPLEYWPKLLPVVFGKNGSGLIANTTWYSQAPCIHFGFTTSDEMQLFYYMYTEQMPAGLSGVSNIASDPFSFQVVPNPMSNNGKLVYTLNQPAKVEARILDVTGKTISRLSEENEEQGTHEITIDDLGKIAAGIYFARLSINGMTSTRKFVVN